MLKNKLATLTLVIIASVSMFTSCSMLFNFTTDEDIEIALNAFDENEASIIKHRIIDINYCNAPSSRQGMSGWTDKTGNRYMIYIYEDIISKCSFSYNEHPNKEIRKIMSPDIIKQTTLIHEFCHVLHFEYKHDEKFVNLLSKKIERYANQNSLDVDLCVYMSTCLYK